MTPKSNHIPGLLPRDPYFVAPPAFPVCPRCRTNAFIAQAVTEAVRRVCDAERGTCESVGIHCISESIYSASFADRRPNRESAPLFQCEIWILPDATQLSVQEYLESFIADYFSKTPN